MFLLYHRVASILENEMIIITIVCPTPQTRAYKGAIDIPEAVYTPAITTPIVSTKIMLQHITADILVI
jgi:hypothetical protein